jgi:hypothetical protein
MAIYILVFFAGLTIGQWLAIWALVSMLAEVVESLQE